MRMSVGFPKFFNVSWTVLNETEVSQKRKGPNCNQAETIWA